MEKSAISVTKEPAGTREIRLTVGIPEEQVHKEMRRVAREIAEQVAIPGFRKGKAPYHVILQRYGETRLREQVAEDLTREVYRAAVEQEGIQPFGPVTLENVQIRPMQFTFTIPLAPVIRLGDYRAIRIAPPTVEVTEEEIQEVLEGLRKEHAILEPIEGRGAQVGDVLRINVEGRTDEGQLFLKDEEVDVLLDPEDPYPAPGFFAALEGMVPGEERTFRLKMPQGQPSEEAEFRVRLLELYQQILPDLDDDLARTVGPFHSLAELKEDIRQQLLRMKEDHAKEAYAQDVMETLVSQAEVEYPSFMLAEQLERLTEQVRRRIQENERMTLEDYLKVTGQTMEDVHERLRPLADKEIRRMLVLQEFARAEGLTVSDEEVEERIQDIVTHSADENQTEELRKLLHTPEYWEELGSRVLYTKTVERLLAIARGEEIPEPSTGGSHETP